MMLVWQLGPALAGLEKLGLNTSLELTHKIEGRQDAGRCQFTGEAGPASAVVSAGHIPAGPSIHARVGFTLVVVDVTVASAPARVACAFVAKAQTEICIVDCVSRRAPPSLFCELGHMVKVLGGLTR